jgi:signal transduction histidine kinase
MTMTIVCVATAAGCATLAAVHVGVWLRDRSALAHLGFAGLAAGVAWFTAAELSLMRAVTPANAAAAFRSIHCALLVIVVSMVVFVRHYLRTGRAWLGHAAWLIRVAVALVTFAKPYSADFDTISEIRHVSFAGDLVSVVVGQTSTWQWIAQAGFALLVVFVIDASIALWRRGSPRERQRAAAIGGTTVTFALLGPLWAAAIFSGLVLWPHVEFFFFLPLVIAMANELGEDVVRTAQLSRELQASEASARELSTRLIRSQEDERRRIARELHDDLSQRLALVAVDVELLSHAPEKASARFRELASGVRDIASEVHRIAYELHPAKLDQLGFVPAARSWCRDLGAQSGLRIDFTSDGLPSQLPPDIALSLYRIVQEALHNVVRHSGSPAARVTLAMQDHKVRLTVGDDGRGFAAHAGGGLGLVSMRERVRSLHGTIDIHSCPGLGTTVEVAIPVPGVAET